jgi:hypothetical protein
MKNCSLCKNAVLEIPGYDTFLDSVFLTGNGADQQLVADGCLGDVHFSCLSRSPWQTIWTNRHLDNLKFARKLLTRQVFDHAFISRNDRTSECCLLRYGGIQWMPINAINKLNLRDCILELTTEVTWEVESELSQNLLLAFRNGQNYQLNDLLDKMLTAKNRLLYSSILQGLAKPFSDDPESTLESLNNGVFDGEIEYQYRLDEAVVLALKELTTQNA